MEAKKCQYCNDEITGKREDAKFCSNTCKAKHWEEKKLSMPGKEEKNVATQLRGVLNGAENANNIPEAANLPEPAFKTVEVKTSNLARWPLEHEYGRLLDVRKRLVVEIEGYKAKLKEISSRNGGDWVVGLAGAGALLGNKSTEKKNQGTLIGAAVGLLAGMIVQDSTKNKREADKKKEAQEMQREVQSGQTLLQDFDKQLKIFEEKLQATPEFNIVKKQIPVTIPKEIEGNNPTHIELLKPLNGLQKDVSDVSLQDINSDKIISSQHLKKMEFKALDFKGKWNTLFGYPSINFHCVVHGMSGEGKSTFAIQFAKYLADSFGRVIYISGEEGFSKTFKDKFSNNNAESNFLDVADIRTFDDIIREVPVESYNFIFIDSLDNMKIDADKMKKIRERYKNSALITISQSTKDGKMRGSYEIVHDCDIEVKVENGIATTTKNRFKEKGMTMNVFLDTTKTEIKKIIQPKSNNTMDTIL